MAHVPDAAEKINFGDRSHKQCGTPISQQPRAPFAVLAQNFHDNNLPDQRHVCNVKFSSYGNVFELNVVGYGVDSLQCETWNGQQLSISIFLEVALVIIVIQWLFVYHAVAAHNNKTQGTFLKKDDPKISMLMQQAELLSSLATEVNTENMDQSLENAWKVRPDFLF